jgi:pantoate--beta-alanine ligase
MIIARTLAELRTARAKLTGSVGLVPTMGALHDGHLELVSAARRDNDAVIGTIFVNPGQFGPDEDFNAYPRTLESDLTGFEAAGADIAFTPLTAEVYPTGFQTHIEVERVSQGLEGEKRPGHFKGVATVVAKLFNMIQPHHAYFGQKDAQQVVVIRRMVADLNFPVQIAVIPTVREADGLARSSRNRYLSPEERAVAPVIYRALSAAGDAYAAGERHPDTLRAQIQSVLADEPRGQVDYISLADPLTLEELTTATHTPMLASLTVQIGQPRLLDNMLLPFHLNTRDGLTEILGRV